MQSRGPCNFYAQGKCLKGDRCSFQHINKESNNNSRSFKTNNSQQSHQSHQSHQRGSNEQQTKRKCRFYQQGKCNKGDSCAFLHDDIQDDSNTYSSQQHQQRGERERERERGGDRYHQNQNQNGQQQQQQQQQQQYHQQQENGYHQQQSQFDQQEQSKYQDESEQIELKNQCMQYFTRGECKNNKCNRSHQASITDDLQLFGKQRLSEQSSVQQLLDLDQQGLLAVCQDKLVLLDGSYQKCKEEVQESHKQVTYVSHQQGVLFIGLYNQIAKTSGVTILELHSGGTSQIEPAHEDWITKIEKIGDRLVTGSLDCKIKIWMGMNQGQYSLESSYVHDKKINVMAVVERVLMVADQMGGLAVLEIATDYRSIQMVRQMAGYHQQQITGLKHLGDYIISVGLDSQLKMISSQNIVSEYSMKGAVSTLEVARNKRQQTLICVGYVSGLVEIYDDQFTLYATIPTHHSPRGNNLITLIANKFTNVNEVVTSTLFIADQNGVMSFWSFDHSN